MRDGSHTLRGDRHNAAPDQPPGEQGNGGNGGGQAQDQRNGHI